MQVVGNYAYVADNEGGLKIIDVSQFTGNPSSNQSPTNLTLSNSNIAENLAIGTVIGNLSTTDPDTGNTFTYSLVTGTGSTDNALFTIQNNQLKTNAAFDFETKNSYSIRVKTTDQGGLSFEKVLAISVTNINETPTNLSLSNSSIAENLAIGTVIGNLSTTDPDTGNTFTYSLVTGTGSTDNSLFTIQNNQLKSNTVFDYETRNSYSIRVKTTDQNGLFYGKALTIGITDILDNATLAISPTNAIQTEGNSGSKAFTFTGTANADTLIGTTGADIFIGLTGNDTYTVNNAGDIVTEALNEGTDLVQASISYTLPDNVENLTLTGTTNVNGAGNSLNNVLTGNSASNTLNGGNGNDQLQGLGGNDILWGGLGDDILTGGTGSDQYLFQGSGVFTNTLGVDYITQFDIGQDKINLSKATFNAITGIAGQSLTDFASVTNDGLVDASTARIVFSQSTGSLFYNQNGNVLNASSVFEFARLGNPDILLSGSDFVLG